MNSIRNQVDSLHRLAVQSWLGANRIDRLANRIHRAANRIREAANSSRGLANRMAEAADRIRRCAGHAEPGPGCFGQRACLFHGVRDDNVIVSGACSPVPMMLRLTGAVLRIALRRLFR